ncbi:MAG: carbamate kinase [bacterium]
MKARIVIAIGGNSLIRSKERGSFADQLATARETCRHVAELVAAGNEVVVTHGNGPQVGFLLIRSHLSRARLPESPLDAANAMTQAEIGYMIQQSLDNELAARGLERRTVTVVTRVVVSADDPSFAVPSKPVGPFYTKGEAAALQRELGWVLKEDAGRGFRRLVPSPAPREVVELAAIERLVAGGAVVVACGGGGIPVVRRDDDLEGVAAVIDKDHASSLLASRLGARELIISTAVERVCVEFGRPGERPLARVTAAEMRAHLAAGQFPEGSMGPKVESALAFIAAGGGEVIITDPEHITEARSGRAGTRIVA